MPGSTEIRQLYRISLTSLRANTVKPFIADHVQQLEKDVLKSHLGGKILTVGHCWTRFPGGCPSHLSGPSAQR